ncbi:MAG: sugar O-acetyltransferase [Akkermansiaceae bacterium]
MTSEKEKMLAGEPYHAHDPELTQDRFHCQTLCHQLNQTFGDQDRADLLHQLLGYPTNASIQPPFHCDYGTNITLGNNVFLNFNCVILDVAKVTIGDNTLIGPSVQIYTATHPIDAAERRTGIESAKPITIGADVWIGGAAIINPGITIGDRSIIGAGSVVTKDIPPDVIAAGTPARIIKQLSTS